MSVFSTLMSWSKENKSCMRFDESREARVCMRVFFIYTLKFLYVLVMMVIIVLLIIVIVVVAAVPNHK